MRHEVRDETGEDLLRGLKGLERFDLVCELSLEARHLPAAVELAQRFSGQSFVIGHLARPPIRQDELEPWRAGLRAFAALENVACKLPVLATEADGPAGARDTLAAGLDAALESFGPERSMFGSSWPVCLLAASYESSYETVERLAAGLSPSERRALFGGTAARVYRLETPYA